MRPFLSITIILLLAVSGCQTNNTAKKPVTSTPVPDSFLTHQLRAMIDTTYDFPEKCIAHPDDFMQQLSATPATPENQRLYTLLLINMGFCLKDAGQVLGSVRYFEKALDAQRQYKPSDIDVYNYITKPLGNLYTRTGDFAKAIALQEMSIRTAREEHQPDILPSLYNNLAITFQQTGQTDSALQACREGIALQHQSDAVTGLLYTNISRCYRDLGLSDSAAFYNNRALSILLKGNPTGDSVIWASAALELKSRLEAEAGHYAAAEQAIQQAIRQTEEHFPGTKQREKAKLYEARAAIKQKNKAYANAGSDHRQVLALFDIHQPGQRVPDNTVTDALHGLASCYRALQLNDTAVRYYIQAIENDYLVQQLIVSKESNYYNSRHARKLLYEALDLLWNIYQKAPVAEQPSLALRMLWITELSKGRQLLLEIDRTRRWQQDSNDVQQAAFARLRYLYEEIAQQKDSIVLNQLKQQVKEIALQFELSENYFDRQFSVPHLDEFIASIDKISRGTDLISWLATDNGLYTFVLHEGQSKVSFNSDSSTLKTKLPAFIQTYFRQGPSNYDNDPLRYQTVSAELLNELIPGSEKLSSASWLISPDGLLYGLPVDALFDGAGFVARKKDCSYTYTLLLNMQQHHSSSKETSITIFSKADHIRPLPDLPYAEKEQQKISGLFHTAVKKNSEATEAAFLQAMNSPDILHIATHAVADSGRQPYLVLTKPITLDKLQYTTTRCPLVFLSACQTASGKLITAEGMESLNKAFLSKGVKGVIAAQWQVDDAVMPQLSEAFYRELYRTHNPVTALAQAKRNFLASAPISRTNPWYWAPLNYTGIDTLLYIDKRDSSRGWILSGLLLLVLLLLVILDLRKAYTPHRAGY